MNVKSLSSMVMGVAVSLTLLAPVQAADKNAPMTPEMEAQMAKAKERGSPGANHEILKNLEGDWTATSRAWMKPGDKVQQSTGTSSNSWILDGRFLKQKFKGDWMGQPFEGIGFIGYDNVKQEYVSVWMDNMSTGMFEGSGQYDAAGKAITQTGTFSCPFTGEKDMWYRSEWKIINKDKNVLSMYRKGPDGKEFRSMEIVYKRTK